MSTPASAAVVRLRPLSVVDDGDDVVIGDPERGTFVAVPAVGGVVVRALLDGATVAEAGARASEFAGEPVDMADFIAVLTELGFVDEDRPVTPAATAPIQRQGWAGGPPAAVVRPLFSAPAWCVYGLAAIWVICCFVLRPGLWPRPADLLVTGDAGTSILIMVPVTYFLVGLHEMWHWLAARALDLRTRFGIDRRLFFLVFETDLSQLWTLPRRKRYGPQLAGLAIDMVVMGVLLAVQLVVGPVRPLYQQTQQVRFADFSPQNALRAMVFVLVATTVWQCMVFLRTDMYGVLVTATGCRDLWRVKSLLARRAFGRLDERQRAELDRADPRDVRIGTWFRWIWLAGYPLAGAYLTLFYLPVLWYVARYTGTRIDAGVASPRFWWGLLVGALVYVPVGVTLWIALAGLWRRRSGPVPVPAGGPPP